MFTLEAHISSLAGQTDNFKQLSYDVIQLKVTMIILKFIE